MTRILIAVALALGVAACGAPGRDLDALHHSPDCRSATPGNSIEGFRCTGDYRAS